MHVAVAYSGGGDSLALLLVARDWSRDRGVALTALHVDHGLRPESAAEAARAAETAERLGVPCRILRWEGDKPAAGVQAAAREARHRLMAEACAALGASWLLLGHTAEDSLETAFMRMRRTESSRARAGLPAVAPSPAWPEGAGLALARPLIDARRHALRERLTAQGLCWIDDPSNENMAFERSLVRRTLAQLGPVFGAAVVQMSGFASGNSDLARAMALRALAAFSPGPLGTFLVDRRLLAERHAGGALALEAVLAAVAGEPRPLETHAVERLLDALAPRRPFRGATLGGAAIAPADGDRAVIGRDPGAVLGRGGLAAQPEVRGGVWDGRFRLAGPVGAGKAVVPAEGLRAGLSKIDRKRLLDAHPLGRRTAPLIVDREGGREGGAPRVADGVFIASQAIARRLLPQQPSAWSSVETACAALGYGSATPHMGSCRPAFDPTLSSVRPKGTQQA